MDSFWDRVDRKVFVDTRGMSEPQFKRFLADLSLTAPTGTRLIHRCDHFLHYSDMVVCFGFRGDEPLRVWSWGGESERDRVYSPEELLRLLSYNQQ